MLRQMATEAFTLALLKFAVENGIAKWEDIQKRVKKISFGVVGVQAGIEFHDSQQTKIALKELISELTKHNHKILLLLDEVQILSRDKKK